MRDPEHKEFLVKLGQRIQALREAQGLTKVQLAFEIGTSEKYVRTLEKGATNPGAVTLLKISQALDVTMSALYDFVWRDQLSDTQTVNFIDPSIGWW